MESTECTQQAEQTKQKDEMNKNRMNYECRRAPGKAKTMLNPVALRMGANQPSLPYRSTSIKPARPDRVHARSVSMHP